MLYMIEEYIKEYPKRPLQALEKFRNSPLNLHEMSLSELNEAVSKWKPLSARTAYNQRKDILNYFKWLLSKGIKVDLSIVDKIEIPISEVKYLIFSTQDIIHYYNLLFSVLTNQAIKSGSQFSANSYLMSYAAGILGFHGLTDEQIIELDLTDITTEGVKGYNLPLTKEDINILMSYKDVTTLANHMPLIGSKYIRSSRGIDNIDGAFLSRPLWRLKLPEEYGYLKNLLRVQNLYQLGVYNRIYELEKSTGEIVTLGGITPLWFKKIIGKAEMAITINKKRYIQYKHDREEAQSDIQKEIITSEYISKQELEKKYDELLQRRRELDKEIQELQEMVKK